MLPLVARTIISREFGLAYYPRCFADKGLFSDQLGSKPWVDASDSAMKEFYLAQNSWLPSWGTPEERGMIVKSVKMWQLGACK